MPAIMPDDARRLLQLRPMPNGGSDCCGTCWFNRKDRGERDWPKHVDNALPDHCEIRDLAIEDPFYTYCANHPHRRPERDRIPIGPVTRHGECMSPLGNLMPESGDPGRLDGL